MINTTLIATRKQSAKTQAQVAKEIGIPKNSYQRYEQGKVIPNVLTAIKIATSLGTSVENLWSNCGCVNYKTTN